MKKTPLNEVHRDEGAKMIDFGGWEMPLQYEGIIKEHKQVRKKCGLFDISHMGELIVKGEKAEENLQKIITNDLSQLNDGEVLYTVMCYPDGGIVDDFLVYRLNNDKFMLVVNAANTDKDREWIKDKLSDDVELDDISEDTALLAVQGPESYNLLEELAEFELKDIDSFESTTGKIDGVEVIISQTGYTGELGYELYLAAKDAEQLWQSIREKGKEYELLPVGLGARNTLRLEKRLCLYGNDLDENTHPLEAGLGWTVKFDKGEFIGRDKLIEYQEEGYSRRLVGFKMLDRGIARHGHKIKDGEEEIGEVSSGSYSPTLEENIGLAYVNQDYSKKGTKLNIELRGRTRQAEVVSTPFV